ncbi:hypothetical protein OROGR_016242 [Orobanche gracilis]
MLNKGSESLNLKGAGDVSIDVLEFSQKKGVRVETKEDPDATENSSSFADTFSGNENNSGFCDAEVESQFFQDTDLALPFDGLGSVFPVRIVPLKGNRSLLPHIAENKRGDLHGVPTRENPGSSDQHATGHAEFGIHDDHVFPEDDNNNNYNFLGQILHKIELVQGRINKMKDKLDSVMTKNAVRFSSSENLSQLVQTSSVRSPTFSVCNGDTVSVGGSLYASPQHMADYGISDLMMPDSAVSSFGDATVPIPDIIESTVGLLSSIDVTQHHTHVGDSSERIVDNMLIQNETADIEGSILKNTQDAENSGGEESNSPMLSALETAIVSEGVATTEQSVLKSSLSSEIHFPKNKRKRGERKAGSGNWTRQRSGEPDS